FAASPYPDGSGEVDLVAVGGLVLATPNWDRRPWVLDVARGWRRLPEPPAARTLHLLPATATGTTAILFESDGPGHGWLLDPTASDDALWQPLAAPDDI